MNSGNNSGPESSPTKGTVTPTRGGGPYNVRYQGFRNYDGGFPAFGGGWASPSNGYKNGWHRGREILTQGKNNWEKSIASS